VAVKSGSTGAQTAQPGGIHGHTKNDSKSDPLPPLNFGNYFDVVQSPRGHRPSPVNAAASLGKIRQSRMTAEFKNHTSPNAATAAVFTRFGIVSALQPGLLLDTACCNPQSMFITDRLSWFAQRVPRP
jgi:hypothetical protein